MRRSVPSPSGSNLPTFFRGCLGGMSAFASGSGYASARDEDANVIALEAVCGRVPALQLDHLARANFVGGGGGGGEGEEEEEEDGIAMCSMPFTQTQPSPPSPASSTSSDSREWMPRKPQKPRICMRKVRGSTRFRAPTPSPSPCPEVDPNRAPTPSPIPCPEGMSAFASGSGSASARDADANLRALEAVCGQVPALQLDHLARANFVGGGGSEEEEDGIAMCSMPFTQTKPSLPSRASSPSWDCREDCGHISTSQVDLLARKHFLGGEEEEAEVFSTPPTQPSPASSTSSDSRERKLRKPQKPRICTRKVRAGTRFRAPTPIPSPCPEVDPIRAPTPSPSPCPEVDPIRAPTPSPIPCPEVDPIRAPTLSPSPGPEVDPIRAPTPSPSPGPEVDPLVRIVLMIHTAPLPASGCGDILKLARSRGVFP